MSERLRVLPPGGGSYTRSPRSEWKVAMAIVGRRRLIQWSLLGLGAALLNACGQKGPLFLPEDEEDEEKKKKKSAALVRPRPLRA